VNEAGNFKSLAAGDVEIGPPPRDFFRIGKLLSAGLLALVLIYAAVEYDQFWEMKASEFGDFIAGVFGPLALLWVVLGYLQQGQELRYNRDALLLQARELNLSAKAQTDLVMVTNAQLEIDRERSDQERKEVSLRNTPIIRIEAMGGNGHSSGSWNYQFRVKNLGGMCQDIEVIDVEAPEPLVGQIGVLPKDGQDVIGLYDVTGQPRRQVVLRLVGKDMVGLGYERFFIVRIQDNVPHIDVPVGSSTLPAP
jgi:hypothetical protein